MWQLEFDRGTIRLAGLSDTSSVPPACRWDDRTQTFRAEAHHYRRIVEDLVRREVPYQDGVRDWPKVPWRRSFERDAFDHQREALEAWIRSGGRGCVELPTGSGKSFVGVLAIEKIQRASLVVVPTLDLMQQWASDLALMFGTEVGVIGGGEYEVRDLTVTTYASAHLHVDRLGNRFGLVIFDECHHLPGPSYSQAALGAAAPFRLGLTATIERQDGQEAQLETLIGPLVYRRDITELAGLFLSEYETIRLYVELEGDDAAAYLRERSIYRDFAAREGISLGGPRGWREFLAATNRSEEGRRAFRAYQEQRRLALAAPAKLELLEQLLEQHAGDRSLILPNDNDTVYEISTRYLGPAGTHQTKLAERKEIIQRFREGEYRTLVTAKVLNEGVDIPEANVAIVLSGSGTVREHVQRLGRILRRRAGKMARLYEIVTRGTGEEYTSEKRRSHRAYQ
ncbi:MAG: DEAD/DEAH box helicase family protein [Planctomycetota bacterium]